MNIIEYIKKVGNLNASEALGMKERTIISYRYGAKMPSPQAALNIEKRTHGVVTFRECYPLLEAE